MRFRILHESPGRVRLKALQYSMSMEQADILEAWVLALPCVDRATVHERLGSLIIQFRGDREALYSRLSRFSYEKAAKSAGSSVYAGSVVEEGNCVVRVTHTAGENRYDRIVRMIEESERLKSGTEKSAYHLADKLVPWCLAGSVLTWLLTGNVKRAVSVLMVDFSCALKLSMPLSVLSAMREAGQYKITVKGGKYMEILSNADTVVFDKTGTLTNACPTVSDVVPFHGLDEKEMLRAAACLEEHFPHSVANAVVRAARERGQCRP